MAHHKKPDIIFFDPPYYIKKEKAYREKANEKAPSISSCTREDYESFLEGFFTLAHKQSRETRQINHHIRLPQASIKNRMENNPPDRMPLVL